MLKRLALLCALVCLAVTAKAQTTVNGTFLTPSGQTPAAAGLKTLQTVGGTAVCGQLTFVPYNASTGHVTAILWNGKTYLPQETRGYVRCSDGALLSPAGATGISIVPNTDAQPSGTLTWMSGGLTGSTDGSILSTNWSEAKAIPDQSSVDWGTLPVASIVDVGYQTVSVAGIAVNPRTVLNFISGATCSDNTASSRTDCSIGGLTNPMTTLGDIIYGGTAGSPTRLPGNATNARQFFISQGSLGAATAPTLGTLTAADLPLPTTSSLGGIQAYNAVSHQWISSISSSGVPASTQPSFADISGVASGAQLPAPSATTLGGIQSYVGVAHQWVNSISTSGVPSSTQPSFADVSGTLAAAQCPNPSATTNGCVESFAATSHQWINSISVLGVPVATQPAFSDISGVAAASQIPNPSATTIGGIESYAAVGHQWINSISTLGVPSSTQPGFADLSGSIAIGQTPLTTLGDILYVNSTPALARLPGNTATTKLFLTQAGNGTVSASPTWQAIAAADIPSGSNCGANQFVTGIAASLAPACAQPTFSNISGVAAASQLPNPSATTLGGIESLVATAHQWINTISTFGVPSSTQPAFADISGTIANSQFPNSVTLPGTLVVTGQLTANGNVVVPGTLTVNQAGNGADTYLSKRFTDTSPTGNYLNLQNSTGSASIFKVDVNGNLVGAGGTFTSITDSGLTVGNCVQASTGGLFSTIGNGCVQSVFAVSHKWVNSISSSGVPSLLQPSYSDISGTPLQVPNDATTGTTVNTLAKINSSGNAVIAGIGDTSIPLFIVTGGAGTSGNASLAPFGEVSCVFDGATTALDFVEESPTIAGNCRDLGASPPTSGWVVGQVTSTNAAGGTYTVLLSQGYNAAAGGGGGGSPGGTGSNLQFRSGSSSFGGVPGSAVDSAGGLNLTPASDTVGVQLVPTSSGFADPFEVFNQTTVAAPAAPTASSISGGTLGAQTLFAKIAYVDFRGILTIAGTETTSQAVTANHLLTLTAPTPNAVGAAGYVPFSTASGGASGTETQQPVTGNCTLATGLPAGAPVACALTATWTEPTGGIVAGANPPASNFTRQRAAWFDTAGNLNGLWFQQTLQDQTGSNFAREILFGSTAAMGAYQWETSAGANLVSLSGSSTLNAVCVIGGNPIGTDCPSGSPKLGDIFLAPALTTVAGLASSPPIGTLANVSNGNSATDCTVGGGTTIVTCRWSGTAWASLGGGAGGGSVNVNGSAVSNPNFNGTTPAAGAGNANCTWQVSVSSVSCEMPNVTTINGLAFTLGAATAPLGSLQDTNGVSSLTTTTTASAVNQIAVADAATGNAPSISATGTDTNVGLTINNKGTGAITVNGALSSSLVISSAGAITASPASGANFNVPLTALGSAQITGGSAADNIFKTKPGVTTPTGDQYQALSSSGAVLSTIVGPSGIVQSAGTQILSGADYTNSTVTPSTVFSWTLPPTISAKTYRYSCEGAWESTNTTLVGPVFGLNISVAPTQLTGTGYVKSALNSTTNAEAEGYLSNATTGSQTLVTGNAAGVTSTNYYFKIWGTIEGAPTAGSTFIINAASTSGTTATLNIRRGSSCVLQ